MLLRLDWDSKIKWIRPIRAHHDITVGLNGRIYVLAREDSLQFWNGLPVPVLEDFVAVFSPDRKMLRKVPLYAKCRRYIDFRKIVLAYKDMELFTPKESLRIFSTALLRGFCLCHDHGFDMTHTNSIEIMNRDIENFCNKGYWLVSMRELDLIEVLNHQTMDFVWSWGQGELDKQHCPNLLENGNVLVFDNGPARGFSRVIELNPAKRDIEWEYRAKLGEEFFSNKMGFSRKLPNGNILITESSKGRVFEITHGGQIVWEYFNPKTDPAKERREIIYRMKRVADPDMVRNIEQMIRQREN